MTQGTLFPLKVERHAPARGQGKDVRFEAIASDGMEWMLKRQAEHPAMPATEFFCYRLAQTCGLATPMDGILTDLDGSKVFGSRIEAGLFDAAAAPAPEVIRRIANCAGQMSACYAVDLMVGNEDRHFGNFLFRERADGNLAAMVIDFGRSWWVRGWPPKTVAGTSNATTTHIGILRSLGRWSVPDALVTLGTISAIPVSAVQAWLDTIPAQWLPHSERAALLAWWGGPDFQQRISACVNFCR